MLIGISELPLVLHDTPTSEKFCKMEAKLKHCVIRQEYDPVKSYGHASLFNEHYLSQRSVYAQELAGASPNLKGKKKEKCGASILVHAFLLRGGALECLCCERLRRLEKLLDFLG